MSVDTTELRLRLTELLESVRSLLFGLERDSAPRIQEQVLEMRLRVDREIEALR